MANTFTLQSGGYNGRYLELSCVQTTDIANNRSTINWTLSSIGGNSNYYTTGPTTVTIAGSQVYYCAKMAWDSKKFPAAKGSVSGSLTVNHDTYGKLTIAVSMSTSIYTGVVKSYSNDWTLDDIPRWAIITSATNFTDVDNPSISFSNPGGFPMDVWLEPNPVGDHLCVRSGIPNTGSYSWNLTEAEREALRSRCGRNSCTIRLGLYTYIGGVQYADYKDMTYTMTENAATKPVVHLSVSRNNGSLPSEFADLYIQGKSRVDVSISANGKYGADIASYLANIDDKGYQHQSFTSDVIQSAGLVSISCSVKDVRGFSNGASQQINVAEYSKPAVTAIAYRCDSNGDEDSEGMYMKVGFTATITSLGGRNSASYTINYGGTPISGTGTSYISEPIACDVARARSVEVTVSDKIDTTVKAAVVPVAFTLMDFYHTGKGIGFGKVATRDGFDCAMDAYFTGSVTVGNKLLVDLIYPVGSIYMSTNNVSPQTFFGGTWYRIQDRFLLAAGSTYNAGGTGGSATHTLTTAEMPYHNHVVKVSTQESISSDAAWRVAGETAYSDHLVESAIENVKDTGGNAAHNNMPPYLVVYMWKRTK